MVVDQNTKFSNSVMDLFSEDFTNQYDIYDTKLANGSLNNQVFIIDSDTEIPALGNLKIWEIAGLFVIGVIFISIYFIF